MAGLATFAGGMILFFIVLWLAMMAICILAFIFWIWMIVDVAKRKFKNETDKIVWILVVVLAGVLGAIIYYFVVKREDNKK